MNEQAIERSKREIEAIAARNGIEIERIVVYGSQVREDHRRDSDLDLVLVSSDWEGVNYYARPERFNIEWPYDDLPSVDVVPLTPTEFERRSREEHDVVRTAVETGVVLEPTET